MLLRQIPRLKVSTSRFASTLVIADTDKSGKVTASTLSTLTAASKIGNTVNILVTGSAASVAVAAKEIAGLKGVSKVLVVENDVLANKVAEDIALTIVNVVKGNNDYTHVLSSATNYGKNFMPRAAAILDVSPVSDVIEIIDASTIKRPMYAGNAIATVKMNDKLKMMLIRSTAFDKTGPSGNNAPIEKLSVDKVNAELSSFISESVSKSERPDLSSAKVVVSGGRGMKNGENFKMLETLADKLGGAVGASRAAVDAGFVPNDYQVGQTGKVVAPDLYIAVGISGAIQHLSGMKDSKTIVAINKDKEAPIFQVADYGLVDDLFKVIPEINTKI